MTTNDIKDSIRHFDFRAQYWSELYTRASFKDRRDLFVRSAKKWFADQSQVLDYGCGSGVLTFALSINGFNVIAVDASKEMIVRARAESNFDYDVTPIFDCIDPDTWFSEPREYENIICSSVIEYVEDELSFLRQLASILKPGGYMLISVPNATSLIGRLQDLFLSVRAILGKQDDKRDLSYAKMRYTKHDMADLGKHVGLEVLEATNFEVPKLGSWSIPLSRNRLVGVMTLFVLKKNA